MKENKKLKYQIKYAIIPIKESTFYRDESDEVIANIVSKCYVIGKREKYLKDGTCDIKYEIVFPYTKDFNGDFKRTVPKLVNGTSQYSNSIFVSQLFNSFEEAQLQVDKANYITRGMGLGKLLFSNLDGHEYHKETNKFIIKHEENVAKYKEIEAKLEEETSDMEVTKTYNFDLEGLINKIVEKPNEFYIKLTNLLSPEEREYLTKLIEDKNCTNCTNTDCRVEYHEKIGLDEFGNPKGNNCFGWNNKELIGKQLVLTKNK